MDFIGGDSKGFIYRISIKEMEVLFVPAIILALYLWFGSYRTLVKVRHFRPDTTHRTLFAVLPFFCVALIVIVLLNWSSADVRSDAGWIVAYAAGGAAWLQLGLLVLSLLGVSVREDVLERQNPAAAWVVYGALIGTTLCYAGSNVGSGPGPEVVLFCAILSTAFLFGFWFLFERMFGLADRITIERDESAGIRVGGWILSLGMVFGGAVTGNWVSVKATLWDFYHYAWVALLFLVGGIVVEGLLRSSRARANAPRHVSAAVALAYSLGAAVYVVSRGIH